MTLNDLIRKAHYITRTMTTGEIPVMLGGKELDIDFEVVFKKVPKGVDYVHHINATITKK